ncbi:hypothetical protein KKH43_01145 [Patescibacteria group bacterium]|nr:hypothetical protein [Patescibacteria group bacterium]
MTHLRRTVYIVAIALGCSMVLVIGMYFASYFLADYQYKQVSAAYLSSKEETQEFTKEHVEDIIFLSTKKEIQGHESPWGWYNASLDESPEDNYWIQYSVLGFAPIDVKYTQRSTVEHIFESYE